MVFIRRLQHVSPDKSTCVVITTEMRFRLNTIFSIFLRQLRENNKNTNGIVATLEFVFRKLIGRVV